MNLPPTWGQRFSATAADTPVTSQASPFGGRARSVPGGRVHLARAWWGRIGVANDDCRTAERRAQLCVDAAHGVIVSILRAESSRAICLSITSRLSVVASR